QTSGRQPVLVGTEVRAQAQRSEIDDRLPVHMVQQVPRSADPRDVVAPLLEEQLPFLLRVGERPMLRLEELVVLVNEDLYLRLPLFSRLQRQLVEEAVVRHVCRSRASDLRARAKGSVRVVVAQ